MFENCFREFQLLLSAINFWLRTIELSVLGWSMVAHTRHFHIRSNTAPLSWNYLHSHHSRRRWTVHIFLFQNRNKSEEKRQSSIPFSQAARKKMLKQNSYFINRFEVSICDLHQYFLSSFILNVVLLVGFSHKKRILHYAELDSFCHRGNLRAVQTVQSPKNSWTHPKLHAGFGRYLMLHTLLQNFGKCIENFKCAAELLQHGSS